jgi:hypothetical protein
MGHCLRLDEVPSTQRLGRDADIACRGVNQPLDQIGRFRPAGAAIGVDRQRIN